VRFFHEGFYDADPAAVRAMLLDREFRSQVCDYQRVLRHTISIEEIDGAVVVDVDQVQSTEYVPSTARAFVGSEIEIGQRETWHSPTEAALVVDIPGRPGRMDGAIRLEERDGGTVEVVTGEIKVGIPLIGGKLEQMVGQVFGWALDAQARVGADWLTDE
jgi:hypothetical protein